MKATELRIGNLVNGPHGVAEITEIGHQDGWAEYFEYREDVSRAFDFEIQMINPIPLTEEWLKKFGFYTVAGRWYIEIYNGARAIVVNRIIVEIHDELIRTFLCDIKYVHQLQNLYFALTGEELEIKNP